MSGIYIKGMEMPKSCRDCYLKMNCDDCEGWECVCLPLRQEIGYSDDLLADKRRDDCNLIPVPDHGRLVDGDKIVEGCKDKEGRYVSQFAAAVGETVESAPTIIPADLPVMRYPQVDGITPTIIPAEEGQ